MEFNILKKIQQPVSYLQPDLSQLYTSVPNKVFINPGVGNVAKSYSIFVPIYSHSNPHSSNKTSLQTGFGALDKSNSDKADKGQNEAEPHLSPSSPESEIAKFNDRKRQLLGDDIFNSFMHPKIKTGKLELKQPAALYKESTSSIDSGSLAATLALGTSDKTRVAKSSTSTSSSKPSQDQQKKSQSHKFKFQ